ncbi:hypothetical protein VCRA2113O415_580011 [Vibrio crassostreae]|nr:hypothetical protein VCRA2113O415_580011 [Vibrio crassostreae]CAK2918039.1 hypothetical protein VCRA2113O420_570001 [Vibrio crassostreae]CAK3528527.1 hypothetical protein VCRA2121O436_550011 [Vibrio crassostreae]
MKILAKNMLVHLYSFSLMGLVLVGEKPRLIEPPFYYQIK